MRWGKLPRFVTIINPRTGKKVVCKVTDRGPYADTRHRIIDVSTEMKRLLGNRDLERVIVIEGSPAPAIAHRRRPLHHRWGHPLVPTPKRSQHRAEDVSLPPKASHKTQPYLTAVVH